MFWFDAEGLYHTGIGRNVVLLAQFLILFLTSSYALHIAARIMGNPSGQDRLTDTGSDTP